MDISLVILAAGIGARYGGGVKQLEGVGPHGELIIDYSIHDAIEAGFNKIVFILRKDIFDDFYDVIGRRMEVLFSEMGIKWAYTFQNTDDLPVGRSKPWGTGEAVLSCEDVLDGPFAVINSDDYYGKNAYKKAYAYLTREISDGRLGLVGYVLENTLSDNGGVTRGICRIQGGELVGINETKNIIRTDDGASSNGKNIPLDSIVSMNMWMAPRKFIDDLAAGFPEFKENLSDPLRDEYLLPTIVDGLLNEKKYTVDVIATDDSWFGVTYREDKKAVMASFQKLYEQGIYRDGLYDDIKI